MHFLVLAMLAAPAFAQPVPPDSDLMDDGELLNRADVQQELELLEDQIQGLKNAAAGYLQKVKDLQRELSSLDPNVGAQRSRALLNEYLQVKSRARQELLLPHQLQRLAELRWQYRAVRDPIVAFDRAVGLSDEQKEQMRTKESELRQQLLRKVQTLHDRQEREVLDVLTPAQRREWQQQTGDTFNFQPRLPGLRILRRLL